ncbi:MAG: DUF349 domain-containing protein [Bacteroidales bacterium]|jgi:hypothetical protein|nr:DUF349 domain-containing protein [Bacteroidales bacterium]
MEDNLNKTAADEGQLANAQSMESTVVNQESVNETNLHQEDVTEPKEEAVSLEEATVEPTPEPETTETKSTAKKKTAAKSTSKNAKEPIEPKEEAASEKVKPKEEEKELVSEVEAETEEEEIEIADDTYDALNKEEAVTTLEEVVKEKDINKIKKQVSLLKLRYLEIVKEEKERKLEQNLSEDEEKSTENQEEIEEKKMWEERFNKAFSLYKTNKQSYIDLQEQEKIRNLEEKKKLLEDLKSLIDSNDSLKSIYDSFKEIQDQWKSIGPVPQSDITDLWQNYHFYVEKFFDKVKISKELKELDLKKNLEQKLALCEKAEALLLESSVFAAFNTLQQYHNEWKEIGAVPDDKKEEIWFRFKNASDLINQKRREHYENLSKNQENNYQAKLALCNKVQEITNIEFVSLKKINEVSKETEDILKAWKTIGPAPKQHNEEIWEKFKAILDAFYESKKQYFDKLKDEQLDNYNKKLNLCIQAEAVALRTDWRKATDELLKLQKEWKEIGVTARKQSEKLWKRFRTACDAFFAAKANYFKNIESHESENLAKKEALIQKVKEDLIADTKEANLELIKNYQREWMEIGYTPLAEKERLWKEFRAAIDRRFEKLNIKQEDVKKIQYQQKIKNILEDNNSSDALRKEKRFMQNKMNQLKEDVLLWENNLGFFANSKNADLLKAEFEKKIDKAKEEIKELESKLKLLKEVK